MSKDHTLKFLHRGKEKNSVKFEEEKNNFLLNRYQESSFLQMIKRDP